MESASLTPAQCVQQGGMLETLSPLPRMDGKILNLKEHLFDPV